MAGSKFFTPPADTKIYQYKEIFSFFLKKKVEIKGTVSGHFLYLLIWRREKFSRDEPSQLYLVHSVRMVIQPNGFSFFQFFLCVPLACTWQPLLADFLSASSVHSWQMVGSGQCTYIVNIGRHSWSQTCITGRRGICELPPFD